MVWWWTGLALAGPAPRNVVVLYNGDVAESEAVALHYADARPGARLCPVSVDPVPSDVDFATFDALIRQPFDACVAGDAEITTIVTVRGLPYRVVLPVGVASLEAVLQVGHATDASGADVAAGGQQLYNAYLPFATVPNPEFFPGFAQYGDFTITNPYQGSYMATAGVIRAADLPDAFERSAAGSAGGVDFAGELYLVGRLDGFDYADAEALVDRAIAAESSPPTAPMLCMLGADEARGARDPECELATRMLAGAGIANEWVPAFESALSGRDLMAWISGAADARGAIDGNTYAPGAIVDNLTSYGAYPSNFVCSEDGLTCPASENQTSIARWVRAGATLVHGTVEEPLNNSFPNASVLLFYAAGYSAGESWLFAQPYLHWQNLWLGDPLTTPYQSRPIVTVSDQAVEGEDLVVTATHPEGIATIRLWIDGVEVASGRGDTLATPAPARGEHTIYAEAQSANATWEHPGWPVATSTIHARTPGWTTVMVDVVAEPTDTASPAADPEKEEPGGCGCDQAAYPSGGWGVLLSLLLASLVRHRIGYTRVCTSSSCSPAHLRPRKETPRFRTRRPPFATWRSSKRSRSRSGGTAPTSRTATRR